MRRILTLSVPDADTARRGQMVLIITLLLLASTLLLLAASVGVPLLRVFVAPCVLLLPLLTLLTALLHRGYIQSATVGVLTTLLALAVWAAITPAVNNTPGLDAALAVTYSLIIMLSAFLATWWSALVTGGAVQIAQTIAVQLVPTTRTVAGIALLSFVTTVAVVALFARSFHTALAMARAQATTAQAAQRETAAREAALAKIVAELEAAHARVQQLYDVVQDLETPTIPLLDGALVVPLVGHLDAQRTARLQQSILQAVYRQRAHTLIMDLTGLAQPDVAALQQLLQLAQGVQLLGTRLILTGIGAGVAQQMAEQQIKLPQVQTLRSLDEGVRAVLAAQQPDHAALRN